MDYSIEFLKYEDSDEIQKFINNEWKKDHILSSSRELFEWQYANGNENLNFVGIKISNTIKGILGFIPTSRYDQNLREKNVIWLALWKISNDLKISGIGLKMLTFLKNEVKHVGIGVSGLGSSLPILYKSLGYFTSELSHYYVVNKNKYKNLKLIKSDLGFIHPTLKTNGKLWKSLNKENYKELTKNNYNFNCNSSNRKSSDYFFNRYIKHPFYKYKVYLIFSDDNSESAIISTRIDTKENSNVLRIIDYYGNQEILNNAGFGLQNIMTKENIEYADFWTYGISNQIMENIGFSTINSKYNVIVPSYFEPFIDANNKIYFAYKNSNNALDNIFIYKGDGDQDRPNQI